LFLTLILSTFPRRSYTTTLPPMNHTRCHQSLIIIISLLKTADKPQQ